MKTFVIRILQSRKMDEQPRTRRVVVTATDAVQAEKLAWEYCEGYFQYLTLRVLEVRMLMLGSVMPFGDPE